MTEKNTNEVSSRARDFYHRGTAAMHKENYDYAVEMYLEALRLEPGFYACREALRGVQLKKAGSARGGLFRKMIGKAGNSPALVQGQLLLRTNPAEAILLAEQVLKSDGTHVAALRLLAEAALALGYSRTAVLSLEIAARHAPDDRDLLVKLAATLAECGQVERSEQVYDGLLKAHPNDPKIAQALKNVTARRTMQQGGFEVIASGEGSYRDMLKDRAEAVALEQQGRQVNPEEVTSTLLEEYETRIPLEPDNRVLLRRAAELLAQRGEFDRAIHYYRRILEKEGGGDPDIEKAIADLELRKLDARQEALDPASADYTLEQDRLRQEKREYQLRECQQRAERYPHDLGISFELGQLYMQTGKTSEAIREFQRAVNHPNRRLAAMKHLGQCFLQRGMNDLAARRFQEALKEKPVFDDEKKELLYLLGTVLDTMGRRDEALEQFKQIYEVDIGYRDVSEKIDAYYRQTTC